MSKGKTKTQSQRNEPMKEAQQYLYGYNGNKGVMPEAQAAYNETSQWGGAHEGLTRGEDSELATSGRNTTYQQEELGNQALQGKYDPDSGYLNNTMANMGAMDPRRAYQNQLSGRADMSTLMPVIQNNARAMSQNFNENLMPNIESDAVLTGNYGGSRHGVAQGIAMKGLMQQVGDMSQNMLNTAYQGAQDRQGRAAESASRLGLEGGREARADASHRYGMRQSGIQDRYGAQDRRTDIYNKRMGLLDAPGEKKWKALNRYSDITMRGAGLGGDNTSREKKYKNYMADALQGWKSGGPVGTAVSLFG